jgi:translation initiation factor IF-2
MENDYMKRGYLLPKGCKDLYDVLKLKEKQQHLEQSPIPKLPNLFAQATTGHAQILKPSKPVPLPPVKGEIMVPAETTVRQLAALLGQKPYLIIADLMQIGVFASVEALLGFETISMIARKYGFIAKKAG